MGRVMTATGVTPDIVLANFFIVDFSISVKNSLAVLAYSNNLTVGGQRGVKPLFNKYLSVGYEEISLLPPLKRLFVVMARHEVPKQSLKAIVRSLRSARNDN